MKDFSNVNLQAVKTKTRTTGDDKPYLSTSTTPGRFNINALASQMMGVKSGDKVFFFEDTEEPSLDGRFLIGVGETEDCAALYSPTKSTKVGVSLSFNLAGAFARILQGDPNAPEITMERLEEKGLAVSRASKTNAKKRNYSALNTTRFEVVESGIGVNVDGVEVPLYALVNPFISEANTEGDDDE